jgi:mRNA interferase MazF
MVTPTTSSIILIPFPFSDLSQSKLRPAVVLANAGKEDWILCQITSKSYADLQSIKLTDDDFANGSLKLVSYARPGKLFTANSSLIVSKVGELKQEKFQKIINVVVSLLINEIKNS